MSAEIIREAGWYWVKRNYVDIRQEEWTPALWKPECGAWYTWPFSGIPDSQIIAGERLHSPPRTSGSGHHEEPKVRPEILSRMNAELIYFAGRWKLDGDYLRCRRCNRPCIASRADEDFRHSESCKAIDPESQPWRSLLAILGPLGPVAQPAPAVPDGMVLVPVMLTAEMIAAVIELGDKQTVRAPNPDGLDRWSERDVNVAPVWAALLAAVPESKP